MCGPEEKGGHMDSGRLLSHLCPSGSGDGTLGPDDERLATQGYLDKQKN